jgi:hypothetical protein
MSVIFHVIVITCLGIVYMRKSDRVREEAPGAIAIAPPRVVDDPTVVEPPEPIVRTVIPPETQGTLVPPEDWMEPLGTPPPQDVDLTQDIGDPNSDSPLDLGGSASGTIGVGHDGSTYGGGVSASLVRGLNDRPYGKRHGIDVGTTIPTDKAVLEGLRWLVRHQNPDGSWGANTLKDRCLPEQPCYKGQEALTDNYNEGLTGLALLCFLGAGFRHDSQQDIVDPVVGKRTKIGEVVKNGLKWLASKQNQDGSFSKDKSFIYNESLAAMALAEAYGLTQNRYWKEPAQRAIDFVMRAQRPNPSNPNGLWGWRYASRMEIEDPRKVTGDDNYKKELYDSDMSATAWAVMALKSAQLSGLSVKKDCMDGAFEFTKFCTASDGLVGYLDAKSAGQPVGGKNDYFNPHIATMSALGMCVRIFTQHDPRDPFLDPAAKQIVKDLPTISRDKLSIDYYYWYYGSLALSQVDGPDSPRKQNGQSWSAWNKAMVDAVLPLQDHTEHACSNGGWMTPDRWSYAGGPLYATAINVLTLEVYYRYDNAFGSGKHTREAK